MYVHRIQTPGAHCHIGMRGNDRQRIFLDDTDRLVFLAMLGRIARRHEWTVLGYCLMNNHFHLVIELGERGMADGMCQLNTGYARTFNARHGHINHLFGRRYWDRQLESEDAFLEAIRYVVLNPVRAGLVRAPEDWLWSSYRATAGIDLAPAFLATGQLLRHFGSSPGSARANFVAAVRERMVHSAPVPAGRVRRQPPSRIWAELAAQG